MGDPHLVGGFLGAYAEDLEFPLAFGDLGVDALVVNAGIEAEVQVLINDFSGYAALSVCLLPGVNAAALAG